MKMKNLVSKTEKHKQTEIWRFSDSASNCSLLRESGVYMSFTYSVLIFRRDSTPLSVFFTI